MSKKNKINIKNNIISQIKTGKIKMKPRWYFFAGSTVMFFSLVGLSMGVIFLINLNIFFAKKSGPLTSLRIQTIISTFPWWIPIVAIIGIILAIWLLKKYDFSYKKNSSLIIITFIISILVAGFLLDKLGLNEYLLKGRMKKFYQPRIELYERRSDSIKSINYHNNKPNIRKININNK
jgi:ABC-type sulfate transport system permease subunit